MAAKPVIVVEHEDKARTLREQCGGECDIIALNGPPARVENRIAREDSFSRGHECVFAPAAGQEDLAALIADPARNVLLAFDEDLRGGMWAWLANGLAAARGRQLLSLPLAGLEREEIARARDEAFAPEGGEAEANYLRTLFYQVFVRHLQRLLGTAAGPGNLPLSYHSLAVLLLINTREQENAMYAPPAKWRVEAAPKLAGGFDSAVVSRPGGEDALVFDRREEAEAAARRLHGERLKVARISRREMVLAPPAAFTLPELIREAWVSLAMPPRDVLLALRKMYYGVMLDGRRCGLVSNFLPGAALIGESVLDRLRAAVAEEFGADSLAGEGEGDDGLPAGVVVPLFPSCNAETMARLQKAGEISAAESRLYDLVRRRALASRMRDAVGESVAVELLAADGTTVALHGRVVRQPGFLQCWREPADASLAAASGVAALQKGADVALASVSVANSQAYPPEYYTVESLFEELESFSISLDPLYLAMLQSMLDAGYIKLTPDGCLRPLANCGQVLAAIDRAFPAMQGLQLLAYLQQTAEEVTSGRKALDFAMKQFDQALAMHGKVLVKASLADQLRQRQQRSTSVIKTPGSAPAVQPMEKPAPVETTVDGLRPPAPAEQSAAYLVDEPEAVVTESGGGEDFAIAAASGESAPAAEEDEPAGREEYPTAATEDVFASQPEAVVQAELSIEPPAAQPIETKTPPSSPVPPPAMPAPVLAGIESRPCPVCGRPMYLSSDQYGRFWNCSGFPACRHAEPAGVAKEEEKIPCPLCGKGAVRSKSTPSGKPFFVCSEESCEFMAWSRPHPVPCGICGSTFLVEKKDASGAVHLRCPRAGCSYRQPMPGEEDDFPAVSADQPPAGEVAGPGLKKKVLVRRVAGKSAGAGSGQTRKVRVVRRAK